jgi:adenosylcobinamide kinase/adenosylcobinamide-phosphate guanylyltransferase
MLLFISGGVRSGKSTLGEKIVNELATGDKIYLATSKVYDDEMEQRILRHQKNREKKGFITIEKSENIGEISPKLDQTYTVLMDCLGTLVANEMFYDYSIKYNDELKNKVIEKIHSDIIKINNSVANLIIISNEIFSSGITYDIATEYYIEVLGQLHIKIARVADRAIECVFGCNIYHKGETL